jgi:hypothetical protein
MNKYEVFLMKMFSVIVRSAFQKKWVASLLPPDVMYNVQEKICLYMRVMLEPTSVAFSRFTSNY